MFEALGSIPSTMTGEKRELERKKRVKKKKGNGWGDNREVGEEQRGEKRRGREGKQK